MKRIIDVSGELYSFCKNLVAEDEMARVIYFSTPLHEVKSEDCVSKEYLKQSMLNMGWKHPDCTITEFVEGLPSAYPKSDKSSGEWIPVNNPYTELPKKDLWVTRSDNGNLCVDRIYYDMTEWSDFIGDVVAYMEYKEPAPYKEVKRGQ